MADVGGEAKAAKPGEVATDQAQASAKGSSGTGERQPVAVRDEGLTLPRTSSGSNSLNSRSGKAKSWGEALEKNDFRGGRSGYLHSLDNRRLCAAQEAGIRINIRIATREEFMKEARKLTTWNAGRAVRVRGGGTSERAIPSAKRKK